MGEKKLRKNDYSDEDVRKIVNRLDFTNERRCEWSPDERCAGKPEWILTTDCGCIRYVCSRHMMELFQIRDEVAAAQAAIKEQLKQLKLPEGMVAKVKNMPGIICEVHQCPCEIVSWRSLAFDDEYLEGAEGHGTARK